MWPLICYIVSWYFWNIYPEYFRVTKALIIEDHQWWRIPLGVLIHSDFNHFISNSLFLSVLGFFIIRSYGPKVLFGIGLTMGMLTHLITLYFMKDKISLVGASGMLYAFWGLWFGLYFLIDRFSPPHRKFMKITALSILLLIPQSFEAHVSYKAHFIGFLVGVITALIYFYFKRRYLRSFEKYQYSIVPYSDYPPEMQYWNFPSDDIKNIPKE